MRKEVQFSSTQSMSPKLSSKLRGASERNSNSTDIEQSQQSLQFV